MSLGNSGTFAAPAAISRETASMSSALPPGFLRPQGGEDGARRGAAVQRVEMDSRRATSQQIGALQRRVSDAELKGRVGIVAPRAQRRGQSGRDLCAAEGGEALDLVDVRDR